MPTSTNGTALQLLAWVLSDFGEGQAGLYQHGGSAHSC